MQDLVEALQIFLKYQSIAGISKDEVSEEDQERLKCLSFEWGNTGSGDWCFRSERFGIT
jgi:hypothetical protein